MSTSRPRVLVQLDADKHASVFDAVVAIDAGVDHLLSYHGVAPADVRDLVHGTMFTRGTEALRHTAIFVGGSSVAEGEALLQAVVQTFFGPMRVSVMMDANGANTTAAAAVVAAARHLDLNQVTALVLGGTGPVGQRAARLLAQDGASVRLASRDLNRSTAACDAIGQQLPKASLTPCSSATSSDLEQALESCQLVISAGAAGVQLLDAPTRQRSSDLRLAIDLNAVPPLGIDGVELTDAGQQRESVVCYGALGIGGTKMKIHKAALARLFDANDHVLDAEAIYQLGKSMEAASP